MDDVASNMRQALPRRYCSMSRPVVLVSLMTLPMAPRSRPASGSSEYFPPCHRRAFVTYVSCVETEEEGEVEKEEEEEEGEEEGEEEEEEEQEEEGK